MAFLLEIYNKRRLLFHNIQVVLETSAGLWIKEWITCDPTGGPIVIMLVAETIRFYRK